MVATLVTDDRNDERNRQTERGSPPKSPAAYRWRPCAASGAAAMRCRMTASVSDESFSLMNGYMRRITPIGSRCNWPCSTSKIWRQCLWRIGSASCSAFAASPVMRYPIRRACSSRRSTSIKSWFFITREQSEGIALAGLRCVWITRTSGNVSIRMSSLAMCGGCFNSQR
jgi:hypothetical protein